MGKIMRLMKVKGMTEAKGRKKKGILGGIRKMMKVKRRKRR